MLERLLSHRPEQEKHLLELVVDKLGDPDSNVAAKTLHLLNQLCKKICLSNNTRQCLHSVLPKTVTAIFIPQRMYHTILFEVECNNKTFRDQTVLVICEVSYNASFCSAKIELSFITRYNIEYSEIVFVPL